MRGDTLFSNANTIPPACAMILLLLFGRSSQPPWTPPTAKYFCAHVTHVSCGLPVQSPPLFFFLFRFVCFVAVAIVAIIAIVVV